MQLEEPGTKAERFAKRRWGYEVGGGAIGALAGAGMGAIFGGSAAGVVGALMGAAMGAGTAWAASSQAQEVAQHDEELDAVIGVEGGDLGAPGLIHPRPTIGAFSKEVSGAASTGSEHEQADGPLVPPPS